MSLKTLTYLAVLFATTTVAGPLYAVTFNVTPQDDWFEKLTSPGFLQPGDELVFGAGTYDPGNPAITIGYRGTAANPITIRAADGASVVFNRSAAQNTFNIQGAQHLVIKDIEITGGATAIRMGNDGAIPSKFVTLDGLNIHHVGGQGVTANFTGHDYQGMRFVNNHIHHTAEEGEAFYLGCNDNQCQFYDGVIENNYIHHLNGPSVNQGDGIEIKLGSYNNLIKNNVLHDTQYPAITAYGVEGQGARNVIEGNVMWNIENHGIQVASDAIIQNNLILSALYDGIHIQNHQAAVPGNLDVLNNTVRSNVGNDYNTSFVSGHAVRINNPAGGAWSGPILIANNALYPDGPDTFQSRAIGSYQLTPGGVTSLNNIGSATGQDVFVDSSGNLLTDFVDIQNLDAFLLAGSKLIGTGDASLQPSDDFNQTARAGSNDVGAYRYGLSGNPGWVVAPEFKNSSSSPGVQGDFDADGDVDADDLDALATAAGAGSTDLTYDLDGDGVVTFAASGSGVSSDSDYLVRTLLGTEYGDATLDGVVDILDLDLLGQGFQGPGSGWLFGDFSGSGGVTDILDLDLLGQFYGFSASSTAIPEPSTACLACFALTLFSTRRFSGQRIKV